MGETRLKVTAPLPPFGIVTASLPSLGVVEPRNQHGRTWSEQRAHLERELADLEPEDRRREIDYQHQLFSRYSTPIESAVRRRQRFKDLVNATRPSFRRRLVQSLMKNWI